MELGANKICLISPYLPYMRQDKRFKEGEAMTSVQFANLISGWVDCLITIDPHLHRIHNLAEVYDIASLSVLHSTQTIAEWIRDHVDSPLIIGPDGESRQWVSEVAEIVDAPFAIIKKTRYGDRKVEISVPEIKDISKTPVLVDDIISSGTTMLSAVQALISRGFKNPICIGIHALFGNQIYDHLLLAGASQVVTCNTIPHPSNKIDITDLIEEAIKHLQ
jgi:ribose-phosphate pyrophosphokinase